MGGGSQSDALQAPEDYKSSTVDTTADNKRWKSKLNPVDLSNASVVLEKDEQVIFQWSYSTTKIKGDEWLAIIATAGIYYCITRMYLKRRQVYTLHVTNKRFIFKEDLYDSKGCCQTESRLLEDQFSYPHSALAFVTTEEVGKKCVGLIPPSVVLEMRFAKYPSWEKISPTVYVSMMHVIVEVCAEAIIWAFKLVYGVDLTLPVIKRVQALLKAADKLQDQGHAILFGAAFVLRLIYLGYKRVYQMMVEVLKGNLFGPMQVKGEEDHTKFRFNVSCAENPDAVTNLRKTLQLITDLCLTGSGEEGNSVEAFCEPVVSSIERLPEEAQPKNVNVRKPLSEAAKSRSKRSLKYLEGTNFISQDAYVKLAKDEVFYEAASNNPQLTQSDIVQLVSSGGTFYFTDIADKIAHTESYALTNRRIIRHSIMLSLVGKTVDHSRVDFWILPRRRDESTFFAIMKFKDEHELSVSTEEFDSLTIRVNNANKLFLCSVGKMLASAVPQKSQPLTLIPSSEIPTYEDLEGAKMTKFMLGTDSSELVENAVGGTLPRSLYDKAYGRPFKRNFFTMTNRGIYVEKVDQTAYCGIKVVDMVYFIPWSIISGVKWETFDYMSSCSFCCCDIPCGCCKTGASSSLVYNYETEKRDLVTAYAGTKLSVFTKGNGDAPFEIIVPNRFVGTNDNAVDAAVKSLNQKPDCVPVAPIGSIQGVKPSYSAAPPTGEKIVAEGRE